MRSSRIICEGVVFPDPLVYSAADLRTGMVAEFERDITEQDILTFARLSGDANPLHVNAEYAAMTNYDGRIVHGAFQAGLASAMIGMYLPGKHVLLGSVHGRFLAPLYYPVRVHVRGELIAWSAESRSGGVRVTVSDASTRTPHAEIHMGVTLHEQKRADAVERGASMPIASHADGKPAVLITGAAGSLGAAIAQDLASDYSVYGIVHRSAVPAGVTPVPVDLRSPDLTQALDAVLGSVPLYGVVHASWPGMPRGGLMAIEDAVIEDQLAFGAAIPVRLARYLAARSENGGRFVVLGSIVGASKPNLAAGAYSLAKSTLEMTVRLLAPELARKQITINAVCPSFVATGINKQADERRILRETALVPLGRVCTDADVCSTVRYLLSPAAGFISGQSVVLSGGQL